MNKKVSIVEMILQSQSKNAEAQLEGRKITVTEDEFFATYCSKAEFGALLNKCDQNDLKSLEYLLKLMHDEQKFEVTPFEKLDVNKNQFVWVNVRNKNTSSGFKVLTAGNMCQFIGIYGFGLITSNITLESLYRGLTVI